MKTLILSVWHAWWGNWKAIDTGANANWTNEATEVNHIVDQIKQKGIPGISIVKVPLSLNLLERIKWINANLSKFPEPFAIEFHMDSSTNKTAKWASVRYNDENSFTKWEWGQFLMEYTRLTGFTSRHVNSDKTNRHWDLGFVSEVKCASLLIELGFISNPTELESMRTKSVDAIIKSIQYMNNR